MAELQNSTTEEDLLDMLGGSNSTEGGVLRKTPSVERVTESSGTLISDAPVAEGEVSTTVLHPTPPFNVVNDKTPGNSPAPDIPSKAINAQARFLEERRQMQEKLAAKKKEKQRQKEERERTAAAAAGVVGGTDAGAGTGVGAVSTSNRAAAATAGAPTPVKSKFTSVSVVEPTQRVCGGYFSNTTYWVYKVVVNNSSFVIRRFRDVVALDARIHAACKGCILPSSPDKHSMRALEDGSTVQTEAFALGRAEDMTLYFNELISHPIISNCEPLNVFFTLQDDLGTLWPEVSSSAVTRMKEKANVNLKMEFKKFNVGEIAEDSISIADVVNAEDERLNVLLQAIPKLESATVLLKEQSEYAGDVGMEMTKLIKDTSSFLPPESNAPLRILSNTLLRSGRRSKRGSMELSVAVTPLSRQYLLVENARRAFSDRKESLQIRLAAKRTVEAKTIRVNQCKSNRETPLEQIRQAEMARDVAKQVLQQRIEEAKKVGESLIKEVETLKAGRRRDYMNATKIIASSLANTCTERKAIWEQARQQFIDEIGDVGAAEAPPMAAVAVPAGVGEEERGRNESAASTKSIDM